MTYTSFAFLVFLLFVFVIYYIVPKKFQWVLLLCASYAFYLFSGVKQVFFILATTVVSYSAGLIMQKFRNAYRAELADVPKEEKEQRRLLKKAVGKKIKKVQVATILVDLGILAFVKYTNFTISQVNSLFSLFRWDASVPLLNMIVPLGISFYTFASMGYVIDIGRGKYDAERNFGKFALFVSFFPTIVQGPISRFDDVGVQLGKEHKFDYNNLITGAELMLWGFFKKLVIAENIMPVVNTVFSEDYALYNGAQYVFAMLCYALQIYCDFSGGIDIARGAAKVLGIDLPQNFERPYFSTSVSDYWKRWHITLGGWMRDYVFYSVMLSKPVQKMSKWGRKHISVHAGKVIPSVVTSFTVFLLIGIWHGASWQYVAFGLYNATVVAGGVALDPLFKKAIAKLKINTEAFSWKVFQIIRTFTILSISKILVKAPGLGAVVHIIKCMFTQVDFDYAFGLNGNLFKLGVDRRHMLLILFCLIILVTVSVLQENGVKVLESLNKQNFIFRWAILLALLILILVCGVYGPGYNASDFIYQAY